MRHAVFYVSNQLRDFVHQIIPETVIGNGASDQFGRQEPLHFGAEILLCLLILRERRCTPLSLVEKNARLTLVIFQLCRN